MIQLSVEIDRYARRVAKIVGEMVVGNGARSNGDVSNLSEDCMSLSSAAARLAAAAGSSPANDSLDAIDADLILERWDWRAVHRLAGIRAKVDRRHPATVPEIRWLLEQVHDLRHERASQMPALASEPVA